MTEKERKKLCWLVLKRGKKYRLSRWRTNVQRSGKGKNIDYTENVDKYYQKGNIDYSEKPKVTFRKLQPKFKN